MPNINNYPSTFPIAPDGSANPVVGIVKTQRPAVLYGVVRSFGPVAFTLTFTQSNDNGQADAYVAYPVTILEGGSGTSSTITVQPGGVVTFIVPVDANRDAYIQAALTGGQSTAQGELEFRSQASMDERRATGVP